MWLACRVRENTSQEKTMTTRWPIGVPFSNLSKSWLRST
jgi:hypothetical protein